jgi:Enoyl-CoA hydratase/isomerase
MAWYGASQGVARPESVPDDVHGRGVEKPWIAAVDCFAIGGHWQIHLAMEYVLAADDAHLTRPARREGIIPGLANRTLPRFTGDRPACQLIQNEHTVFGVTNSGAVSAAGNRRALRVGAEPHDLFRRYESLDAREHVLVPFPPSTDRPSCALLGRAEQGGAEQVAHSEEAGGKEPPARRRQPGAAPWMLTRTM